MTESIVIQQPPGQAQQLVLLFHGLGETPQAMLALGERLARQFPNAFVVSVVAAEPADGGTGHQWLSVRGLDDANRTARVSAALPAFLRAVAHWQAVSGLGPVATALIGFSQGAIMALEATRVEAACAGRVVAIAGRFTELPERAAPATTLHLFHGKQDEVIPYRHTIEAVQHLLGIGGDATADVLPFVGHTLVDDFVDLTIERLTGYVPKRLWDEAMRSAGAS
ncbi:MAG: esterase [Burkholderiales bacterium]|nr:esterase [Burkholderiales bacterium]